MADVVPEKSRGLKFAEQQLLRHGWEQGKGLGRAENGICEAIKVKVKCDKGGVGHREGDQFTFQWWDHVFNKASSSLQVESDQSGVKLKKTVEEGEEEGMISNKRPRKAAMARDKLYGCFVKSDTLLSGQKQPALKSSDSSDDSSSSEDEEDKKLDLSSTFDLSDAALMKACGGRTGHKGARHGLTMNAKLARLEQQEAEFMAKYGKKKNQPATASTTPQTVQTTSTGSSNELNADTVSESAETDVKPKKKKEKKKKTKEDDEVMTEAVSNDGETICVENSEADHKTKRKHKSKRKEVDEVAPTPAAESKSPEETDELHSDTKAKKKKKKKKNKSSEKHSDPAEEGKSNDTESSQSEPPQDCVPKTKKKKSAVTVEQSDIAEVSTVKQKRKKCKKDKSSMDDDVNEEGLLPPKKKKKTKCKE